MCILFAETAHVQVGRISSKAALEASKSMRWMCGASPLDALMELGIEEDAARRALSLHPSVDAAAEWALSSRARHKFSRRLAVPTETTVDVDTPSPTTPVETRPPLPGYAAATLETPSPRASVGPQSSFASLAASSVAAPPRCLEEDFNRAAWC